MFDCSVEGCDEEVKINGKCVVHMREEILSRRAPALADGPLTPLKANKDKRMRTKVGHCVECQRRLEGERPCKGKCPDCRGKSKALRPAAKPKAKTKTPKPASPQAEPRSSRGSAPSSEGVSRDIDIIEQLKARFWEHIEESRKIYRTLKSIEELTGVKIDLPEIEP